MNHGLGIEIDVVEIEQHNEPPHSCWRTLTFLAAQRCDRIDAPCVLNGPINGQSFLA